MALRPSPVATGRFADKARAFPVAFFQRPKPVPASVPCTFVNRHASPPETTRDGLHARSNGVDSFFDPERYRRIFCPRGRFELPSGRDFISHRVAQISSNPAQEIAGREPHRKARYLAGCRPWKIDPERGQGRSCKRWPVLSRLGKAGRSQGPSACLGAAAILTTGIVVISCAASIKV